MAENFIDKLLSQLGAGSKEMVFVSVTPGIGLEMIQVDVPTQTVKNYGSRPLEYNDSMREITSYETLKVALQELFDELKLSPKNNIYFSLPLVHMGKIDLPLLLNDEGINEAIISTVEQAYIFKRCEPVVSWFEVLGQSKSETRTIMYTALQKTAVDKIKEIVEGMGGSVKLIEASIVSILRALSFTKRTEKQMDDNVAWNLMLVSSMGYSIISMMGERIIDYYEEPIAFKTYELEEVYNVINSSVQLALMNFPSNYLYIISQTDLVSAEHLAGLMPFEGTIDFFEDNSYKKDDIIQVSLDIIPSKVKTISLESIGLAVSRGYEYPIYIDYSGNTQVEAGPSDVEKSISIHFNGKEIVLTESVLKKIAMAFSGILIVPALAALIALPPVEKQHQAKLDDVNKQIETVDKQIKELTEQTSGSSTFNAEKEIENVLKANRMKLMAYSALGESVPRNLWITYFSTSADSKIDIKGVCDDVEGIYKFFKNMKDYLVDSQLRLYKLEMTNSSIDSAISSNSGYQFEITNMSESELNPDAAAAEGDAKAADGKDAKAGAKNDSGKSSGAKKVEDLQPVEGK